MDKSTSLERITQLVEKFKGNQESYKSGEYNETQTRIDFINPFFKALGWDVDNEEGVAESYRDVIHEDKVVVDDQLKAPDYCFTISGQKKFYVEAKKPSIFVKEDIAPAFQVRRYGWSAKLPIGIVTDFEEFAVYDCSKRPKPDDKSSVSRIRYLTFQDYVKEFDFLWDTFSKEMVRKGSFDRFVQSEENKKGTATVDKEFLQSMDDWRLSLAKDVATHNPKFTEDEVNYTVQQTIDRIVFLRICEDRRIEPYGRLRDCLADQGSYKNLLKYFLEADAKYNSGLFNFEKDQITPKAKLDDKTIKEIVSNLYYPKSPFVFSEIPVEILGNVYEQFLGKVIRLTGGHHAKVEEKPEVRKAGGVYYTPQYIVDYIVQNTVSKLVEGKSPKEVSELRVLDPACGSGSFLLGAYQFLLDWHKEYYRKNPPNQGKDSPLTPDGKLATAEKKRILLNNIYGVDIDPQAVEVTKLSLLLKALEGETTASINMQMEMFHDKALPSLEGNIKCGNSLVGSDYYDDKDLGLFEKKDMKEINAMDWDKEFPEIFKRGGFDAVIGNPPYGSLVEESQKKYMKTYYKTPEGRYDNFELFIEKGMILLNDDGLLSFIVPSPFLTNLYSRKLRELIINQYSLCEVVGFSMQVFDDPTVHTCIINIKSHKNPDNKVKIKKNVNSILDLTNNMSCFFVNQNDFRNNINFVIDIFIDSSTKVILDKLYINSVTLGDICYIRQCIKTGDDEKYVDISESILKAPWKKSLRGKSIQRYRIVERNVYLKYGEWLARNWKNTSFYETNKIAIRETGNRITATLDLEFRYFLSSLYAVYYKDKILNNENDLKFLLAIINSKVSNYFIKIIALNLTDGAFTKVRTNQLARLPIPIVNNSDNKRELIILVDQMFDVQKQWFKSKTDSDKNHCQQKAAIIDQKIDKMVYKLYNLTDEDIRVVEGG